MAIIGNLDKLIEVIAKNAEEEAQRVIAKAKERANDIIKGAVEEAKSRAEREASELLKKEREGALRKRRSEITKMRMEAFRKVLEHKERLIEEVVEEAKRRVNEYVKTEDYKNRLVNLIKEAIRVLNGGPIELRLNRRDLALNLDLKAISAELGRELNRSVELRVSEGSFLAGLVAKSAETGIEVDYTVEGILERKWKNLRVEVAKLLFTK
ncbi:MAG: V-type ATP synthase subunit E family protein [Candidatus Nezhaarchaeota archaeon]|nr:V-type ATP synthase subunit E family protein [Candidatus Nezhaarchaeota archaeon]